jgi:hypothetical protein
MHIADARLDQGALPSFLTPVAITAIDVALAVRRTYPFQALQVGAAVGSGATRLALAALAARAGGEEAEKREEQGQGGPDVAGSAHRDLEPIPVYPYTLAHE